jgi:hypothetical protein
MKDQSAIDTHNALADWYLNEYNGGVKNSVVHRFYTNISYTEIDFRKLGDLNKSINPFYELEWADSAFDSAAKLEVGIRFLTWAKKSYEEEGKLPSLIQIVNQLQSDVLEGAKQGSRSSSTSSNKARSSLLEVKARLLDNLMSFVDFVELEYEK